MGEHIFIVIQLKISFKCFSLSRGEKNSLSRSRTRFKASAREGKSMAKNVCLF